MSKSIWTRRLDLLYLVFFLTHIPVMLCVDLASFYPISIRPKFTITLRDWYVNEYRDRFFVVPPLWFKGFLVLELVYHLPLSIWAVSALLRDDPMVPLQLLCFAIETALTTLTSTLEMLSWEGYSLAEQQKLCGLYVPYLLLAIVMGTDMFIRISSGTTTKAKIL